MYINAVVKYNFSCFYGGRGPGKQKYVGPGKVVGRTGYP